MFDCVSRTAWTRTSTWASSGPSREQLTAWGAPTSAGRKTPASRLTMTDSCSRPTTPCASSPTTTPGQWTAARHRRRRCSMSSWQAIYGASYEKSLIVLWVSSRLLLHAARRYTRDLRAVGDGGIVGDTAGGKCLALRSLCCGAWAENATTSTTIVFTLDKIGTMSSICWNYVTLTVILNLALFCFANLYKHFGYSKYEAFCGNVNHS